MVREAHLGEDDCFTLGHAVLKVLSSNQVEMPYGFMRRFNGCFPVQMEGKAMGMDHLPSMLSQGTPEAWEQLEHLSHGDQPVLGGGGGVRKELKTFFAIQKSTRVISTFLPKK